MSQSPPIHDLHHFFAQLNDELAKEYQRIFVRAAEDPGTAGDQAEDVWADALIKWLPSGYHVKTKGRLISSKGEMSPQIDVLVLKPSYPRFLLSKKVWLADGVAAAFECKNTLTSAHVADAVTKSKKIKALTRAQEGSPRVEVSSGPIFGLLAHSHSWKGANSNPVQNISTRLAETSLAELDHPRSEVDLICVADLACWQRLAIAAYAAQWLAPEHVPAATKAFNGPIGLQTAMLCAAKESPHQAATYQPVGAFVSALFQRLAWKDPSLRDLADYFRIANLGGTGFGEARFWPLSTYTQPVQEAVQSGRVDQADYWGDWNLAAF